MGAVCVGWGLPAPPWWVRLADWVRAMFAKKETASEPVVQADTCAAAERLLNQYGDAILRLAYSYLHNRSDAEDILQETLMKYLSAEPALESESHEKAWLLRVAINLSKNKIESNRYRAHEDLDDHFFADEKPDLQYVWDAVKALPQQCAEVIHLYYQEGYSCAEIAKLLRRNEATVRSLLSRGRGRLRQILKEDYDFEV